MPSHGRTANLSLKVTPALKTALIIEAWESELKLGDYLNGLLEHRYKWWRTAGKPGGYALAAIPPGKK